MGRLLGEGGGGQGAKGYVGPPIKLLGGGGADLPGPPLPTPMSLPHGTCKQITKIPFPQVVMVLK